MSARGTSRGVVLWGVGQVLAAAEPTNLPYDGPGGQPTTCSFSLLPSVAGRPRQNGRDVIEQLKPPVERAGADHFEIDVGVPVMDPLPTAAPCDHREDDDTETINEAGTEQRSAQGETTQRAHGLLGALLHLAHDSDRGS